MTLGEKTPNESNRTILLVGETKSGKSTLINAMVNYILGVKWEDDIWFEIENSDQDKCESQTETSDVTVYEICGFKDKTLPYSLTIIDTPGYGNTAGSDDKIVSERLLDLFRLEDGIHEINAVGLVLKASDNRLNDQLRYVFDTVLSLFGKDLENNIVALLTHSCGVTPENALEALKASILKFAKDKDDWPVHFLFNNIQNEDRSEGIEVLRRADEISAKGIHEFLDFLGKTSPQKLETTVSVLNERIRLKASIQNLQERVKLTDLQQKEIQQTKEALKKHEEEMKSNENFTVEVDEVYEEATITGGRWLLVFYEGAVRCKVCKENCHYPGCTMAWYPEHCEVMRRGRCTVCTNRCPVSDHVKEQKIYVAKTNKVHKTLHDIKEKYERSKADCEEKIGLLESLEKQMQELQNNKDQCLEESFKHVLALEQIALNIDSLSTHVHLDFLIEKLKEKEDSGKVQKLEEIKSRADEGLRAAMPYFRYKVTKGNKVADAMKENF